MRNRPFFLLLALFLSVIAVIGTLLPLRATFARESTTQTAAPNDDPVTLTLLHNNDGESALLTTTNVVPTDTGYPITQPISITVGGVAAFKTLVENEIGEATTAGNAVLNVYAGDAFLASSTLLCSLPPVSQPIYDAIAQRQIPYTAHIFGNHEFDYGPDFLSAFIRTFDTGAGLDQPFLSANLDFSAEPSFTDLIDPDDLIEGAPEDNRPVAHSMIVTDTTTSAVFGIVGATTPLLPVISSPGAVTVTATITETAVVVQDEITRLESLGVNKIIFVSHLQDLENDVAMLALLRNIDIAVGGGGDELLVHPAIPLTEQLLPGEVEAPFGDYPMSVTDADGQTVYLVTSRGNYKYVGRLDVSFDENGEVTGIIAEESYPRRVIPADANDPADLVALGVTDAITQDVGLISSVVDPLEACLADFAATNVAFSEVVLDVSRNGVRGTESNAGNLIVDGFVHVYETLGPGSGVTALDNPVVGVTNGGGIRQNAGDILQDVLSRQNTIDVLPFANNVSVIENMTPEVLKEVFEHSVGIGIPDGRFLQVSGITVTYNISNPTGSRVVALSLADGTPIVEDGEVVSGAPVVNFVTNSFTAAGGDEYAMLEPLDKIAIVDATDLPISYERALLLYLAEDDVSFPENTQGLPTIQASDERYAPGGEGRIQFVSAPVSGIAYLMVILRP